MTKKARITQLWPALLLALVPILLYLILVNRPGTTRPSFPVYSPPGPEEPLIASITIALGLFLLWRSRIALPVGSRRTSIIATPVLALLLWGAERGISRAVAAATKDVGGVSKSGLSLLFVFGVIFLLAALCRYSLSLAMEHRPHTTNATARHTLQFAAFMVALLAAWLMASTFYMIGRYG